MLYTYILFFSGLANSDKTVILPPTSPPIAETYTRTIQYLYGNGCNRSEFWYLYLYFSREKSWGEKKNCYPEYVDWFWRILAKRSLIFYAIKKIISENITIFKPAFSLQNCFRVLSILSYNIMTSYYHTALCKWYVIMSGVQKYRYLSGHNNFFFL